MVKKEQIIMWGSVLLVIIVLGLAFSGGENNYLNPSGNRNPANQKLMIVDQDTGEISFIQKSLQGVNAQIATDDSVISAAIAQLRTDMDTKIAAINKELDDFKNPNWTDDVGNKENTMKDLRYKLDTAIRSGHGIAITFHVPGKAGIHGAYRLASTCNSHNLGAQQEWAKWSKTSECKVPLGMMSITRHDGHYSATKYS